MSFRDRLRPNITLTSPSGVEFTPKWQGNEQSKEKKLGRFSYPNNNGTRVQDLGIDGTVYPLTLHFDGEDHDIDSKKFYDTCDEKGNWTIIHPVDGQLTLQLISVSRNVQPVESASITICETQWIEPLGADSQTSSAQLASQVNQDAIAANLNATIQAGVNANLEKFSGIIAFQQGINNVVDAASSALDTIKNISSEISAQFDAITRAIEDTLDIIPPEVLIVAGQIQQLIQLPVLAVDNIQSRLDAFQTLTNTLFPFLPTSATTDDINTVAALEVGLSASIVAACQSAVSGELTNRSQAVEFAVLIQDLLADVTENLDNVQEAFSDNDVDLQYFSNSQDYNNLKIIVARTLQYLIDSLVSLKIEKTFILDRPRSPVEITVTEYGDLGDNDENLDFFILTNALTDKEIRLLPSGREVVVYV